MQQKDVFEQQLTRTQVLIGQQLMETLEREPEPVQVKLGAGEAE
jgi:hypothetical protein